MRSRAGIVVASRTPQLLSMHLTSHDLFTDPEDAVIFLVLNGPDTELMAGLVDELFPPEMVKDGALDVRIVPAPPEPFFYGNLCNAGAKAALDADCDVLVFLNDDTVVRPEWLNIFFEDLEVVRKSGMSPGLIGARSECVSGPQSIHDGMEMDFRMREVTRVQRLAHQGQAVEVPSHLLPVLFRFPRIVTFAAACTKEAWAASGGFDPNLPAHNWSDDILSCRMFMAGYPNFVGRAFVAHFGSQTTLDDEDGAQERYAKDMEAGAAYVRTLKFEKAWMAELDACGFVPAPPPWAAPEPQA